MSSQSIGQDNSMVELVGNNKSVAMARRQNESGDHLTVNDNGFGKQSNSSKKLQNQKKK